MRKITDPFPKICVDYALQFDTASDNRDVELIRKLLGEVEAFLENYADAQFFLIDFGVLKDTLRGRKRSEMDWQENKQGTKGQNRTRSRCQKVSIVYIRKSGRKFILLSFAVTPSSVSPPSGGPPGRQAVHVPSIGY